MIAIDTNILVYSHRADLPQNEKAQEVVRQLAEGRKRWAIAWPSLHEFYSVVTNPRIFKNNSASTPQQALEQIEAWLESPSLTLISESPDYFTVIKKIVLASKARGPLVHDARIYAICQANGVHELLTADRDFSIFAGNISIRNPL